VSEEKSYLREMQEEFRNELSAHEKASVFQEKTYDLLDKFGGIIFDAYENGVKEGNLKVAVISVATGLAAASALAVQLIETEAGSKEPIISLFETMLLTHMDTVREDEKDATTTEQVGNADNPNTVLSAEDNNS
jgi:hypothetical protein